MDLHRENRQKMQLMQLADGGVQVIEKPKKSRTQQFIEAVDSSGSSTVAAETIVSEIRGDPVSTNTLRKALKIWAELREEEADEELSSLLGY